MKKSLLLLGILFYSFQSGFAQSSRFWATYYGGSAQEFGNSITTDAAGNVYMTGSSMSGNNIGTLGTYQPANAGSADAFLVKFNAAGVRQWGTYFGGSDDDLAYGVKTDAAGNIFIVGYTYSTSNIATSGAYQGSLNGVNTRDAFLAKFNSSGGLIWATYYGGENYEQATSVGVDAGGNVFMAGRTSSTTGIALPSEFQSTFGGPAFDDDGFLVKFSPSGARLWGTYYGGNSIDGITSLCVDPSGNVLIGGNTYSPNAIASPGAFKTTQTGFPNCFLAKFNPAGSRIWGTYYGDIGPDNTAGVATDQNGNVYLGGTTMSSIGIASGGFQNTFVGAGTTDAFLVKFSSAGTRIWGTYYGDTGEDEGGGVATDSWGNVFFAGDTYSPNPGGVIAPASGFQTSLTGSENQFLVVFSPNGMRTSATYYGQLHEESGIVAVSNASEVYLAGDALATSGLTSLGHQNSYGGALDAYLVKFAARAVHWEVIVPNDSLPPGPTNIPPKIYISSIDIFLGGGISISNATLKNFSPGAPLPASGSTTITLTCDFTGDMTTSAGTTPVACTALVTMKVTFSSATGPSRVYDTELLQLDLSGGTLPPGVIIRESPTLQSNGLATYRPNGSGQFLMSCYFDVYTELSTNGGANWLPNTSSPARLELRDSFPATIPTLGEWGLILLTSLFLFAGLFYIRK